MNDMEKIVRSVFARQGIDFSSARRAGGWTNMVWLTDKLALRLSPSEGSDRIRREAALSKLLPERVGYPRIVECGVEQGHEFSVSARVPGVNLSEVWPALTLTQRADVIGQLWEIAEAVRSADVEAAAPYAVRRAWYATFEPDAARETLNGLIRRGAIDEALASALWARLRLFFEGLAGTRPVLNHGDLTMDNALWYDGTISSVMDFEHAAIAPAQMDAWSLLNMAFGPGEADGSEPAGGFGGAARFRSAALNGAEARLRADGGLALWIGFGVLHMMRILEICLDDPDEQSPIERWSPYRALAALASEDGGCFSPVFERFG